MTDKVQKIKDWISKTQDGLMDAQGNFEYSEHEGAYHILCNLDTYIDSLQEEPVSRTPADIEAAMQELEEKSRVFTEAHHGEDADTILAQMRGEEPVSKDLEKIVEEIAEPTILNAYGTKELARRLRNTVIYGTAYGTSVSEDLEEELRLYINSDEYINSIGTSGLLMIASHFASWQKEQMMKDLPNWKKVCPDVGQTILYQDGTNIRLQRFGYEIEVKELDNLPKQD